MAHLDGTHLDGESMKADRDSNAERAASGEIQVIQAGTEWLEQDRETFFKEGYKQGAKHIKGGVACKCVPVHSFFHVCVCAHVSLCMRKYICMQAQKR